jgi:hypothetical protein
MFRRFTEAVLAGIGGRSLSRPEGERRPRSTSATSGDAGASPAARPAAAAPTKQLLLLDDEEAILLPTAKYFRSLGWTVDLAREAEEGEALISHRHYDLAILDVRVTRFGAAATTARASSC